MTVKRVPRTSIAPPDTSTRTGRSPRATFCTSKVARPLNSRTPRLSLRSVDGASESTRSPRPSSTIALPSASSTAASLVTCTCPTSDGASVKPPTIGAGRGASQATTTNPTATLTAATSAIASR